MCARNIGPQCRICRRMDKKLFLKGERCYTIKCQLTKRKSPPGAHGGQGYSRLSEYGTQLKEKQILKANYGILERQLKKYFNQAKKKIGNTETILLSLLEKRLDNVIYRTGFALSRKIARQIINHGHIKVNQKKVDIPSYQVRIDDLITINLKSHFYKKIQERIPSFLKENVLVGWLSCDPKSLEIKIIKEPEIDDLPRDINIKSIIEFYSR